MWWDLLNKQIISSGLYSQSGTEIATSSGALKLEEIDGEFLTSKVTGIDVPEESFTSSPDYYLNYPSLNKYIFGKYPKSWLIGNYEKIFVGYYKDQQIRRNGASAGIVTGVQTYLLNKNLVNGVITTKMSNSKPYVPVPSIATTDQEIFNAAQSKYTPVPLNVILSKSGKYKSLVYTGLPHHIAGVRKLQQINSPLTKNITLVLGIFYGETIGFSAIRSIMRTHKVKGLSDISKLKFREGEWPGYFYMKLNSGKEIRIRKLYANYLIPSHITDFSLYQVDYMSELADISVGDAWAPTYEQRGEGWSVVIARNKKGLKIIKDMQKRKLLELKEISEQELVSMHSHGLDLKKRGAFIRIERREKKGLPVPHYGYKPVYIPRNRYIFESILSVLFFIFKSPLTIFILENLPIQVVGGMFIHARNLWKAKTKSTKGTGLYDMKFTIEK